MMDFTDTETTLSDLVDLQKIGEGTYGVVYKCRHRVTGRKLAIKKIRLRGTDDGVPSTTIREVSVLRELQHPNIVCLEDVIMEDERLFLVFEFLSMDLKMYIDKFPKGEVLDRRLVKSYMFQIATGIHFCHQRRVVHRDLKPQNLLINHRGAIKIADFGLARTFALPVRVYTHEVVTLWYRAPEILMGTKRYSTPVDVWSIGAIFADLLIRCPLFKGDSEIDQLFKIFRIMGTPTEETWPEFHKLPAFNGTFPMWKECKLGDSLTDIDSLGLDLIQKTLKCDPAQRISCKKMLLHAYFLDVDTSVRPVDVPSPEQS